MKLRGVEGLKPSAVFFIAVDLLRSLGKRFPVASLILSRIWHMGQRCTPNRQQMDPSLLQ